MQKIIIQKPQSWIKTAVAFFAASALIVACTDKDENEAAPAVSTTDVETVCTPSPRTISIRATFKGDGSLSKKVTFGDDDSAPKATGSFDASEKIYGYNVTKKSFVSTADAVTYYLKPSDISADGKSCTLSGTITGPIDANDVINLYYNMTVAQTPADGSYFDYGTQSTIVDGGIAENITVTSIDGGNLTTKSSVEFTLCQSTFRFKFQYGEGNAIKVKSLLIKSSAIASYYYPLADDKYRGSDIIITPSTATDDYLYVAFCIDPTYANRALSFTVTDEDDFLYTGSKNAPSGGFANGKYYYNTSAITLEKSSLIKPTITGTTKEPNEYNRYDLDETSLTISGRSQGYYVYLSNGGTITINNLTATYDEKDEFIYSGKDLTLNISGTNTINSKNWYQTVYVSGTLKLSGNGTLTVTANDHERKGLYGKKNYNDTSHKLTDLAADDYTVTCSDITDNRDGTYTWTYTVAPSK